MVPALVAESLGMPVVTVARAVELQGEKLRVTRVTSDGRRSGGGGPPRSRDHQQ